MQDFNFEKDVLVFIEYSIRSIFDLLISHCTPVGRNIWPNAANIIPVFTNHIQGYNRMQACDWWIPVLCWQRWTRYSFWWVYFKCNWLHVIYLNVNTVENNGFLHFYSSLVRTVSLVNNYYTFNRELFFCKRKTDLDVCLTKVLLSNLNFYPIVSAISRAFKIKNLVDAFRLQVADPINFYIIFSVQASVCVIQVFDHVQWKNERGKPICEPFKTTRPFKWPTSAYRIHNFACKTFFACILEKNFYFYFLIFP